MKEITNENIIHFLENYCYFHDSYITNIIYNVKKAKIELSIVLYWKNNNTSNLSNKIKLKMIFDDVERCNIKEINSYDYIQEIVMKIIKLYNKDFFAFSSDINDPVIDILCERITYKEEN